EELALLDLERLIDADPVELHRSQLPVVIEHPEQRAGAVVQLDLLAPLRLVLALDERTRHPIEVGLLRRVAEAGVVAAEDHAGRTGILERQQEILDAQGDGLPAACRAEEQLVLRGRGVERGLTLVRDVRLAGRADEGDGTHGGVTSSGGRGTPWDR